MSRRIVDTRSEAKGLYQTFMDRPSKRELQFDWTWPDTMQYIGQAKAQMYKSNKWKRNLDDWELYKHIAEDYQECYSIPGFLVDHNNPQAALSVHGPFVDLDRPMPKHFAILAPSKGVQIQLNDAKGRPGDIYQVDVRHAYWGGARHPVTKEHFLFLFSKEHGVGMIITGNSLSITRDGIAG